MYFLPQQFPSVDAFTFFGIALFICHTVAEFLYKTSLIPKTSSYILAGVIFGPNLLNLVNKNAIIEMSLLSDVSIGLVLFLIGRHLDLKWLRNDKGLLLTCIFEFIFTIILIAGLLVILGWTFLYAFTVALIISTISPAIILLVTQDLNAEGPITRRSLAITSANNFIVLMIYSVIYPYFESSEHSVYLLMTHSVYRLMGSIGLGCLLFKIFELMAIYILPKRNREQFILLISMLILTITISNCFNLPTYLTLISFGVATRNLDLNHNILEYDLNFYPHIFFIPLFFMTGCYLDFSAFLTTPIIVIACIFLRVFAKTTALLLFKNKSCITTTQSLYLSSALVPLSGFAVGISSKITGLNPDLGVQLTTIVSACIGFFGVLSPLILQYILIKSNEAFDNLKKV